MPTPVLSHTDARDLAAAPQADALFTALYVELRRMARREVWRNGARGILGTTTLVHEAWIDINQRPPLAFEEPGRFLAYAARTMRGLVIDRVRAHHAHKRGGGLDITSLDTGHAEQVAQPEALDQVSAALDELAMIDPALAQVVDLKFFCGFTLGEVAQIQGISERTAQRQWEKARGLLYQVLQDG